MADKLYCSTNTHRLVRLYLFLTCFLWPQPIMAQEDKLISRIAFGSCANQQKQCPIWTSVSEYQADLLLLLGDNVYADIVDGRLKPSTPERIAQAYQQLADDPGFSALRRQTSIMATWDDHDFGNNDAGREWEHKEEAAKLFHDFFGTPIDSDRRQRQGVYHSEILGPAGKRVQIIMLDTRFFRSELEYSDQPLAGWRSRPYRPATGPEATVLGEQQWKWLEEQLLQPAELRIIGSSIQVISDEHPFEKWGNFPEERERLYELIRKTGAGGVVIISGDRHLGEISLDPTALDYPLMDVTASGLNQANTRWRPTEPNSRRVAALQYGNHFGAIEIDWHQPDPMIRLQLRHEDGELAVQTRVPLSTLQATTRRQPLPEGVSTPQTARKLQPGTRVTVRYRVEGGRDFSDTGRVLLNSHIDFRHETNLTVVIGPEALVDQYKNANVQFFMGKEIEVTGEISVYRDQPQIVVNDPVQIKIIN
jgi:alkaline phosphatase D